MRALGGTTLSARSFALGVWLRVVALENLLVFGWVKVGVVKRMVWGLFRVRAGAAAERRGMVMGVAVGCPIEVWRCCMAGSVSLVRLNRKGTTSWYAVGNLFQ